LEGGGRNPATRPLTSQKGGPFREKGPKPSIDFGGRKKGESPQAGLKRGGGGKKGQFPQREGEIYFSGEKKLKGVFSAGKEEKELSDWGKKG